MSTSSVVPGSLQANSCNMNFLSLQAFSNMICVQFKLTVSRHSMLPLISWMFHFSNSWECTDHCHSFSWVPRDTHCLHFINGDLTWWCWDGELNTTRLSISDSISVEMKFAEHLAAHITPEWRKQYIQYEVRKLFSFPLLWQRIYKRLRSDLNGLGSQNESRFPKRRVTSMRKSMV